MLREKTDAKTSENISDKLGQKMDAKIGETILAKIRDKITIGQLR